MDSYDVIVLGTGGAGMAAAIRAAADGARGRPVRTRRAGRRHHVPGRAAWCGSRLTPHGRARRRRQPRARSSPTCTSLSHGMIDDELAGSTSTRSGDGRAGSRSNTPSSSRIVQDFPDYHPEHPGGKPGGGRVARVPAVPVRRARRRGPTGSPCGHQIGTQRSHERDARSARGAPGGCARRGDATRRRSTTSAAPARRLVGRLLKGCLDRGIEPLTGAPGARARSSRTARWSVCASSGPTARRSRSGHAAASCSPPVASSGTGSSCAASSAGR